MKMECVHCGAILKTASSLNQHQKSAKYCLIKQNKHIEQEYICSFCNTGFTLKSSLYKHLRICKANIPAVQEQLQLLDQKSHELCSVKKDLESALLRESEIFRKLQESYNERANHKIKELQEKLNNISIRSYFIAFGEDKPIKAKRILDETYPITSEYFISFDQNFHRESIISALDNSWV